MSTYERLRQALDAIPIVDDHSHVLTYKIGGVAWEGPHEVLPLTRLLLDFNIRGCFSHFGIPDTGVRLDQHL